ncbi:MAG: hypothetical protein Q8L27_03965 [archaeon]|nr:hypothetical protein [archaeon]
MFFAGKLFKIIGMDFKILEGELKKLKNFEDNLKEAKAGFESEKLNFKHDKSNKKNECILINGNSGLAKGAIDSGLEWYYSYPMTPATPVMMELGQLSIEKDAKHKVVELENEIAVMMATLGSSLTGSISMCGTSGGGFDLMTEAFSMAGQAEIPLVCYLSSRPGPSTGLATYSSQGDLDLALYSGHGEFNRIVLAPGDPLESIELTNQAFYLSQKFRTPAIVLGDKNLAESKSVVIGSPKIIEIKKSITYPERFNSYEHDENGNSIEDAKTTVKNFDKRMKISKEIAKESKKFEMINIHGNKNSKNLILGWGSTKGVIIDAIFEGNIDAKFLQVLYLEPFSENIKKELEKADNVLIVENNATSQLSKLIAGKTGFIIKDKNKILRYDGRGFFSDELAEEIKRRMRGK